jgi:DNA polymerase I-like protein with 3'-5' exonuclease and polymerase domains
LEERERCKVATGLGANYGLGAAGLARRLRILTAEARELLDLHRRTYPQFWRWVQAVIDTAEIDERIVSEFGWPLRVTSRTKPNTLRNFKMQAAGGDMLRIALVAAAERGLPIVAPIHDAILLCSPADQAEEHTAALRECMKLAGLAVTRGIVEVFTEAEFHPVRYADPRGANMWAIVMKLLVELEQEPALMTVA